MLSNNKPKFEKLLLPVAKSFSGVNPNFITLLGSIPSLVFFVSVINGLYVLALVAYAGNLFDLIDGMIARRYNKVSAFGGFLDSTLDRVSDFFIITAFSFGGIVRWEIGVTLLFLSFLTSYTRAHGELRGNNKINFSIGIIERPERLIVTFFSLLLYMLFPYMNLNGLNIAEVFFIILILLSFYTVYQRMHLAHKKL